MAEDKLEYAALGQKIVIGPKSLVTVHRGGIKSEMFGEVIEIIIGIGKNHHATLVMHKEDWEALKKLPKGKKVDITTVKQFRSKIR